MKKTRAYIENEFLRWMIEQRFQIGITLLAAVLPNILMLIFQERDIHSIYDILEGFERHSDLYQSLFIFITLFILINNMVKTDSKLPDLKEYIANYVERNTVKRYSSDREKYFTYDIVSATVKQFYVSWIIVWVFWFIFYTGNSIIVRPDSRIAVAFQLTFDFLNSSAIYVIYLILTDVTVKIEERKTNGRVQLWLGSLLWIIIFAILLALLINMLSGDDGSRRMEYFNRLLVSAVSAFSFVLMLGKLNSNYLQIPRPFLLGMYIYAIFQAYIPFAVDTPPDHFKNMTQGSLLEGIVDLGKIINKIIPYVTLIGKVFVMLTLCWIADKKRLIFFIIHESVAMDEAPMLLDELDSDPVEF